MLKNIGGDGRIGSGKKMQVYMHEYGRSTHNKSTAWRSSMAPGTLIPCFLDIGLNGDTWNIEIESIVRTLPTIGPLFGSYKMQVDFFTADIRLYNAQLHNNALNVGRNIENIKFPQIKLFGNDLLNIDTSEDPNSTQINQSSLLAYLKLRGLGAGSSGSFNRYVQSMPILAYWDIYKNYYANKQEEIGVAVSASSVKALPITYVEETSDTSWENFNVIYGYGDCASTGTYTLSWNDEKTAGLLYQDKINYNINYPTQTTTTGLLRITLSSMKYCYIKITDIPMDDPASAMEDIRVLLINKTDNTIGNYYALYQVWTIDSGNVVTSSQENGLYTMIFKCEGYRSGFSGDDYYLTWIDGGNTVDYSNENHYISKTLFTYSDIYDSLRIIKAPTLQTFNLENIDTMRELILKQDKASPLIIGETTGTLISPYNILTNFIVQSDGTAKYVKELANAGLGIKTYQSDRFNNWLNTEWIDGENGINEITAIDTSEGSFTMDTLILQKKIYNMLNRIAMSGGSYNDWQEAVYGQQEAGKPETPVYVGGYSAEITFDEVISNSATEDEPLGTLGGRGSQKHGKQGYIRIKCNEPCIIMGIVSLTPRIDYSQGNSWIYKLNTMNDLHKPALDGIGFQDLPTDEMCAWDTVTDENGNTTYRSAGKQPAYIEWQTNVNECFGNFADINNQMYMTLNRRYEAVEGEESLTIGDVTTYIDPTKFNYAFAQTDLTAQNFWTHLGFNVKVRRIMSAKEMPNL